MKIYYLASACVAFILFLAGCKETNPPAPERSDAKELSAFSFIPTSGANTQLNEEAVGVISGKNVTVSLPDGIDLSTLKGAAAVSPLSTVSANGVQQTLWSDGLWYIVADFSAPVVITIQAEDESTTTYTITATSKPLSAENELLALQFLKADNPSLSKDVTAQINGNVITVKLPAGALDYLVPAFVLSDKAVAKQYDNVFDGEYVGSLTLGDRRSADPKSNIKPLEVRAQNGAVRSYEMKTGWDTGDVEAPESSWAKSHLNRIIFRSARADGGGYVFVWPTTATLEFDAAGRIARTRYYHYFKDDDTGHGYQGFVAYDDYVYSGNTVKVTSHESYDSWRAYQRSTYTLGDNGYPSHLIYEYDVNGASYEATYTYNSEGNVIKEETKGDPWDGPSALPGQHDPTKDQQVNVYEYKNGNLVKIEIPGPGQAEAIYEYFTDKSNYED